MALLFALIGIISVCESWRDDYTKKALGDQITSLPGLDSNTFAKYTMFSGYIDIYPAHNRSIFYWFVESLNDPKTDPIAIWTNGGPGASGIMGMFTEQGPFRLLKNLSLRVQPYSWVNIANMVFFEAPAGVGFSFSDDPVDYITGDNKTAIDNYHFIQGLLDTFPNFQSNDFYITSESYGGHYMPTLAKEIILGNQAGGTPQINFKGIFVGNPFTDPQENGRGVYDTLYGHQMVSQPIYQRWYKECPNGKTGTPQCAEAMVAMHDAVGSNIDPYALDFPVCELISKYNQIYLFYKHMNSNESNDGAIVPFEYYTKMIDYFAQHPDEKWYSKNKRIAALPNLAIDNFPYDPCEENYVVRWMNHRDVQKAIHVRPKDWPGTDIIYDSLDNLNPMEPIWKWIIDNDPSLHITIVSGDDDTICGTLGTQSWMWEMGWSVDPKNNWKVWTDSNGQTGGYLTKFEKGINLLTVHSAGHMIPTYQPSRSLQSFTRYLNGEF